LSTHHGNSTGLLTLFVLPAGSHSYIRLQWRGLVAVWLVLAGVLLLPAPPTPRALSLGVRAVIALVACLLCLIAVAPIVSSYLVVLSAGTFAGMLALALAPRLSLLGVRIVLFLARAIVRGWRLFVALWMRVDTRPVACAIAAAVCGVGLVFGTRALGGS